MLKLFLNEFKVPSLYEQGFENFLFDFEETLGITKEKFYLDYEGKRNLLSCMGQLADSFNLGEEISSEYKVKELNLFEENFIDEKIVIDKLLLKMVRRDTYYVYLKGSYMSAPETFNELNIYIGYIKVEREPSNLKIITKLFDEETFSFLRDPAR